MTPAIKKNIFTIPYCCEVKLSQAMVDEGNRSLTRQGLRDLDALGCRPTPERTSARRRRDASHDPT